MKKMVLAVLTLAAVLLPAGVRVFCFAPPSSHARFWPGTLADDVGRNGVLSEPQQRIHDIANALDAHKLGDLIKQYKKAAVSEPGSAVAHFALGYAYQVQTAYASLKPEQLHLEEGAIERQLQEAIKLDAHLEEAYVTLGAYYVEQSPVRAVEFLTRYLEQSPDDAEAMYWIAMAYGSRAGFVEGEGVTAEDRARYASKYCYDEDKMIEWLRRAERASTGWLLPHSFLASRYAQRARVKSADGKVSYSEPWRSLAIEECKTILRLASPTHDSELIDRIKRRLDDLTKR